MMLGTAIHTYDEAVAKSASLLIGMLDLYQNFSKTYIGAERQLQCPKSIPIIIEKVFDHDGYGMFSHGYRIRAEGRVIDWLCWDEMLGTIAAMTLTGKFQYRSQWEDTYEYEQRIRAIQRRLGPLLDFEAGHTSRQEINWDCVEA